MELADLIGKTFVGYVEHYGSLELQFSDGSYVEVNCVTSFPHGEADHETELQWLVGQRETV